MQSSPALANAYALLQFLMSKLPTFVILQSNSPFPASPFLKDFSSVWDPNLDRLGNLEGFHQLLIFVDEGLRQIPAEQKKTKKNNIICYLSCLNNGGKLT